MGHHALQRVVVRMIYDPVFARSVSADARRALKDVSLSEAEVSWLKEVDPRAFATDVHRVDRTLKAMIDEYPRSTAIIFRRDTNLQGLAAFFSEREFHEAIQNRDSLVLAFGRYLLRYAGTTETDLISVAALERMLARTRRVPSDKVVSKGDYTLSASVALHPAPYGTLGVFIELGRRLAQVSSDFAAAALSGKVGIQGLANLSSPKIEYIMGLRDPSALAGVSLEHCPEALYALLAKAERGCSREELVDIVVREDGTPEDALEIIRGLLDDGILFMRDREGA